MNRLTCQHFFLALIIFGSQILTVLPQGKPPASLRKTSIAVGANPTPVSNPFPASSRTSAPNPPDEKDEVASVKVRLYFLRESSKLATLLNDLAKTEKSELAGLVATSITGDEIILYGPTKKRKFAQRIIATLDLPRPGIVMNMWGIQLTSRSPEKMAEVMLEVRKVIDRTQEKVRMIYSRLQEFAQRASISHQSTAEKKQIGGINEKFRAVLEDKLRYFNALNSNRPLSLSDILLLLIANDTPGATAEELASELQEIAALVKIELPEKEQKNKKPKDETTTQGLFAERPFSRFLRNRGLEYMDGDRKWKENGGRATAGAQQAQAALLDFALNYGRLVHHPQDFSSYYLQQSADVLNTRLQNALEALNQDIEDLLIIPTLRKIQLIVREYKDVEFAQVGRTNVASLSGFSTSVTSYSVNAFDYTPPLQLTDWLQKADTISTSVGKFVPKPTDNLVGAMPLSQVIGLIGALGQDRTIWGELKAGVSFTITPNVLRNMTSAELALELKTGDPKAGTREEGIPNLSRVSQHEVKTDIYVTALDFFDISAFDNQSTLGGGRGYVPVLGPFWRNLFGEVPAVGKLFSWKREPKTVYNQSLVLTNAVITPTVMGVAVLYPNVRDTADKENQKSSQNDDYEEQSKAVEAYKQENLPGYTRKKT